MEAWWKRQTPKSYRGRGPDLLVLDMKIEEISLNGHPGREYNYKFKGLPGAEFWPVRQGNYYVNGCVYRLAWRVPEGGISSSEVEKFFDSFQLAESAPGSG